MVSNNSALHSELLVDVALQQDGKIVVLGTDTMGAVDSDWILVRYNADGSVDHSFAVDGRARVDFSGSDRAKSFQRRCQACNIAIRQFKGRWTKEVSSLTC